MKHLMCKLSVCVVALLWMITAQAEQDAPWGRASLQAIDYAPRHNVSLVVRLVGLVPAPPMTRRLSDGEDDEPEAANPFDGMGLNDRSFRGMS